MTVVTGSFNAPQQSGNAGFSGSLWWQPTARHISGTSIVLPQPFPVQVDSNGTMTPINVDPTGPTWVWKVTEQFVGIAQNVVRYVQVPSSGPVAYKDLVDVDPNSLAPIPALTSATDAWLAGAVQQTQTAAQLNSTYVPSFIIAGAALDLTGATDCTTALQARINAAPTGANCVFPPGTYKVSATITLRADCNYSGYGHTIHAGAAMSSIPLVDTPGTTAINGSTIRGLTFNCDGVCSYGFWLRFASHVNLYDLYVYNAASHNYIMGDFGASGATAEVMAKNLRGFRPQGTAVTSGSIGVWMRYAFDSEIDGVVIVGTDIGIKNDQPDNRFSHCHIWGFPSYFPTICYELTVGADLWGCCADSPSVYGFHFNNCTDSSIVQCRVLTSPNQVTNTVIGAKVESASGRVFAFGNTFTGHNGSVVLANDWVTLGPSTTILGQSTLYCTTQMGRNAFPNGDVVGIPITDKIFNASGSSYPPGVFLFAGQVTQITSVSSVSTSGSGGTFHLEVAGVTKTPVMNIGDLLVLPTPFTLNKGQSAYIAMNNVGTNANITVVVSGYSVST